MDYKVTSFSESANGKKAQITVVVGKGRGSLSFTRHLERHGYDWVGLNFDPRAIPLNERYEAELAEAKREFDGLETRLVQLAAELHRVSMVEPVDDSAIAEIVDAIQATETTTGFAEKAVRDADVKLWIVKRELPLMMSFNPYQR